jgi:hypothetical protein
MPQKPKLMKLSAAIIAAAARRRQAHLRRDAFFL